MFKCYCRYRVDAVCTVMLFVLLLRFLLSSQVTLVVIVKVTPYRYGWLDDCIYIVFHCFLLRILNVDKYKPDFQANILKILNILEITPLDPATFSIFERFISSSVTSFI